MKKLALVATLLVLAACVSGAAYEAEKEIIESFEEVDGPSAAIDTKSGERLFSIRRYNDGLPNLIVSRTLTITFNPAERITLVQIITELPGFVSIVGGGIGSNYLSVRVQSQVTTGYDFTVLINY